MKYRTLSRTSAHRQALLRNLVDALFERESIQTTWHKAKEAQRLAEKLVTLGKRNTVASRQRAQAIFYRPNLLLPKLFSTIRERYANRDGGYTRVLRIEPAKEDQAPSAILELVDGPRDTRFAMTARSLARHRREDQPITDLTAMNVQKVTRYRANGDQELENLVDHFEDLDLDREETGEEVKLKTKEMVYPDKHGLTPKNKWKNKEARKERKKETIKQAYQRLKDRKAGKEVPEPKWWQETL